MDEKAQNEVKELRSVLSRLVVIYGDALEKDGEYLEALGY
jgi:hypothetical protein